MNTGDLIQLGGLLLTILAILASMGMLWHQLDKKTDKLEVILHVNSGDVQELKVAQGENMKETRGAHAKLAGCVSTGLDKVHDRVDKLHSLFAEHLMENGKRTTDKPETD